MATTRRSARFALTGHSGAELTLIETDGQTFVRKRASAPEQSARLRQQCDKLQAAHAAGISCPAVYRTDDSDRYFSFDMEFIPGDSLAHAVTSGREPDWDTLLPQINDLTARYCATSKGEIPALQFVEKLECGRRRLRRQSCRGSLVDDKRIARVGQRAQEVERDQRRQPVRATGNRFHQPYRNGRCRARHRQLCVQSLDPFRIGEHKMTQAPMAKQILEQLGDVEPPRALIRHVEIDEYNPSVLPNQQVFECQIAMRLRCGKTAPVVLFKCGDRIVDSCQIFVLRRVAAVLEP